MDTFASRQIVDSWFAANAADLRNSGAGVERAQSWDKQDGAASYIDIDVGTRTARLVVWPTGPAELQILSTETSQILLVLESGAIDHGTLDQWWQQLRSTHA